MSKFRILLDSNAYLRLANSFHPLLSGSFGKKNNTLYLIPEFQKEFNKSPRLKNKFGWVNQPENIENRKYQLRTLKKEKEEIQITYTYLWAQNISEGFGASRVDVRALAYGSVLDAPVVTDDFDMTALAESFGIEVWGLLDLLKIMYRTKRINQTEIKALIGYLEYIKDLPYRSFKRKIQKAYKIKF
jgi:predicted nucleic acid-binding protein